MGQSLTSQMMNSLLPVFFFNYTYVANKQICLVFFFTEFVKKKTITQRLPCLLNFSSVQKD